MSEATADTDLKATEERRQRGTKAAQTRAENNAKQDKKAAAQAAYLAQREAYAVAFCRYSVGQRMPLQAIQEAREAFDSVHQHKAHGVEAGGTEEARTWILDCVAKCSGQAMGLNALIKGAVVQWEALQKVRDGGS